MRNLLVDTAMFTLLPACLTGNAPIFELPMTGGEGAIIVTAIGISLAAISLLLLFVRARSGKKPKDKTKNQ